MKNVTRRSAVSVAVAGAAMVGSDMFGCAAVGEEPKSSNLWTLEGELKVHSKFVYLYYIVLLDGQKCALYGASHEREHDKLGSLTLPVRIRVRGTLGTAHHSGGSKDNPSPFPAGWWVYMDVHEVETLR